MPLLDGEQSNVILGYLVNKTTNDSTPNYEEESLEGTRLLPLRKCLCAHLQYLTHPIAYVALSFFQFISSVAVQTFHKDFMYDNHLNLCNLFLIQVRPCKVCQSGWHLTFQSVVLFLEK